MVVAMPQSSAHGAVVAHGLLIHGQPQSHAHPYTVYMLLAVACHVLLFIILFICCCLWLAMACCLHLGIWFKLPQIGMCGPIQ